MQGLKVNILKQNWRCPYNKLLSTTTTIFLKNTPFVCVRSCIIYSTIITNDLYYTAFCHVYSFITVVHQIIFESKKMSYL